MGIDLTLLQASKGGDLAAVRLSQERRFASTELVDNTLKLYTAWTRGTLSCSVFFLFLSVLDASW